MIKTQCFDVSGSMQYRGIRSAYYKNTTGILLCFDMSNSMSRANITSWLAEINRYLPNNKYELLIVGTKSDLCNPQDIQDTRQHIQSFCDTRKRNISIYRETSSKENSNVHQLFQDLIDSMYDIASTQPRPQDKHPSPPSSSWFTCCYNPSLS